MDKRQMARYIADKSQEKPIAAFLIDGKVKTVGLDSERLDRLLRDLKESCLGVYDNVSEAWVFDDIETILGSYRAAA
jgi:hypothetical protein